MHQHLAIADWPSSERPRERLIARGSGALSDAELVALLLGTGARGRSAVDCARGWIGLAGDLRSALSIPMHRLPKELGIGPAKWASVQAALELSRRLDMAILKRGQPLNSPDDAASALNAHLRDRDHEIFSAIFLDARHQVLAIEDLFRGGLSFSTVYIGEVVKRALSMPTSAMIVAHNHPSGRSDPSDADIELTRRLTAALKLVDIRLIDHLIVGAKESFSFAQRGLL